MKLQEYMNDGANWQAQVILIYMRHHEDLVIEDTYNSELRSYEASLSVGRYENCREQGYIFSLRYKGRQRNYAVYEHRNSDTLCVVVNNIETINTPSAATIYENMRDKYDTTKDFHYAEFEECAIWLIEDMRNFIKELNTDK